MKPNKLSIDFWDVGQGDCSVIHLPSGKLLIIDVGPPRSPLVEWLEANPDKQIFAIILTHNDEDHAGCCEHILKKFHSRIEKFYFLIDRNLNNSDSSKQLVSFALRQAKKGHFKIRELKVDEERGLLPIYGFEELKMAIYARHPNFNAAAHNLTLKQSKPNHVSGIISLDIEGMTKFLWAGDAPMKTVSRACAGEKYSNPLMIVGPHHGGPDKAERKTQAYKDAFKALNPKNVFISVGTKNGHGHPQKDFIKRHLTEGRRVCCSQLNDYCDRRRFTSNNHVMRHHLLFGMNPPPKDLGGITCRGPIRVTWNSEKSDFEFDKFHAKHLEKVKTLQRPYCYEKI